jgi:thioredoxin-related protein
MKKLVAVMMLATLMGVTLSFAAEEIHWFTLQEGMERAKTTKKPMIVDFYFGKGCPRCEALKKSVYDDPLLAQKIVREVIPIRIDLAKKLTAEEKKLGERYDYKGECLLLFLDDSGVVLKDPKGRSLRFADTVAPDQFIKYLDMIRTDPGK